MNKNYRMDNFVKGEAAFRVDRGDIEAFLKDCDECHLRWNGAQKASEYNPFRMASVDDLICVEVINGNLMYTTEQFSVDLPIIYDYKEHLKKINDKTYDFTKLLNEVGIITRKLQRAERALHYIDDLDKAKNFDIVIHRNDLRNIDVDLNSEADSEYIKGTLKDIKRKELNREAMEAIECICKLAQELDRVTDIDISSEEGDDA